MKEVIKIFEQIKNTSSINDKKAIIVANKDNELFKKCLVFLLDSNIVTGIADSKLKKVNINTTKENATRKFNSFEEVMDYLEDNNTGRDEDIANVKGFIYDHWMPDKEFYFYTQMVTKKYRLGCDKKVVNKAIPKLIPTFDVMLGTPLEKCKLKLNEPISIGRKLNGTRTAFVGNKCLTRQGKEYKGLEHIINDLINMGYENMFVDGELLYKNKEGLSDSEAFQKGTGIAMSKDGDKSQLKLVVFDMFPLDEFWSGKSKLSYFDRKHTYLKEFSEKLKQYPTDNLELVQIVYEGTDHSEIWKWLDYAEEHDWEGCMVNTDSQYECKRTKTLMKVKKFFDVSLRVVDVEEGTGRNKCRLGAIVCKYYDNTVKCGSGFSDEQRNYYWEHKDKILDKIVDIKYKEVTTDKKTNLKSLQFPTFICIRDSSDKPIPDDEVLK